MQLFSAPVGGREVTQVMKNGCADFASVKHKGKIYTPDYLVDVILCQAGYTGGNIVRRHVIDNSCGNGQFMVHVVDRYCRDFMQSSSDTEKLADELETYIHAIEIDHDDLQICRDRCSSVAEQYGISRKIRWDFVCGDALKTDCFDGKMDYVVGNPPYVRVHNLSDQIDAVKASQLCKSGMTDLYIVFYEIGIRMLCKTGTLCYITPSSFFTSVAGADLRAYLIHHDLLRSICDLKHFQPFRSTTYTAIVCLQRDDGTSPVDYYEFDEKQCSPTFVASLMPTDFFINGLFYFSLKKNLCLLKDILSSKPQKDISVKNGYATLADSVFVRDFNFVSSYVIPVVKASRGKLMKIIFPYDEGGRLVAEEKIKKDAALYCYLNANREQLLQRSNENTSVDHWYAYGRSQGINDTFKDKLAINSLIRSSSDLKIVCAPCGTGVYSGLYIVSQRVPLSEIAAALRSKEFCDYIALLGKYRSGGYYTYSSKDVKCYLNYRFEMATEVKSR